MGHPESEHWGGQEGSRGAYAHSPGSGRMRGWPSVTKASPTRSGKTQLSTGSPGPPDTSTESIFRRAWKAPVFWAGAEPQSQRQPRAVPGRRVHRAPPSASCASDGGGQKPTSGGPLPAGLRRLPGPAGKCAAPGAGAGPRYTARVAASASVPASAPARPFPLARASGCRPAPASRPLPGRGAPPGAPSPARPLRPKAGRHWEGEGGPQPARGRRGRYLAIAAAASRKPRGGHGCGNSPVWPRRPPPEAGA